MVAGQGRAWVPGYGLHLFIDPDYPGAKAIAQARIMAQGRKAEPIAASDVLVEAELRHHLPPPTILSNPARRLTITRRGGNFFGAGTYTVVAVGNFTEERKEAFIDAVRRLKGHLQPAPRFTGPPSSDRYTAAKPTPVDVFEIEWAR